MADVSFGDFVPNSAGIMEVFKGGGMQAALGEAASRLGAEANALGHLHGPHDTLYQDGVDVLDRTAIGYVSTANHLGAVDQGYHHTLDAINH